MIDPEQLKTEIRSAFGDIKFPKTCGIRAARLRDDWITDKEILERETIEKDYKGHWWNVPEEHISGESLGFHYLDSCGVEFYLPAFMTLAIDKPTYRNLNTLCFGLVPIEEACEEAPKPVTSEEMYKYYCDKYSKITGDKKKVVIKFMEYITEILGDNPEPFSWEKSVIDSFNDATSHEHWKIVS